MTSTPAGCELQSAADTGTSGAGVPPLVQQERSEATPKVAYRDVGAAHTAARG